MVPRLVEQLYHLLSRFLITFRQDIVPPHAHYLVRAENAALRIEQDLSRMISSTPTRELMTSQVRNWALRKTLSRYLESRVPILRSKAAVEWRWRWEWY